MTEICDERKTDEVAILKRGMSELDLERRLGKIGRKEAAEVESQLVYRVLEMPKLHLNAQTMKTLVDLFSRFVKLVHDRLQCNWKYPKE